MPVTEVFASDGRTMVIASSELETYKNVGWFENYIATLYSIDGRTINVYAKDVPAYKNVGWYDRNEYYMAMADKYASEYGYRSAVEYLEGLFDDGKYTDALGDKKVEFCSAWMKEIITTRQTGGLHKGYKPIMPTRVSRRGLSLCSSLRVFASLATPKGVS